jgi:WD40 repeat protein
MGILRFARLTFAMLVFVAFLTAAECLILWRMGIVYTPGSQVRVATVDDFQTFAGGQWGASRLKIRRERGVHGIEFEILIHDLRRPRHATSLNLGRLAPTDLAVTPQGDSIAFICGRSQSIYLCNGIDAGKPPRRLTDPSDGSFNCIAFSPDGQFFAAGQRDWIWLWRMPAGQRLRRWRHGMQESCLRVSFSADAQKLLSAGGSTSRLWEAPTGELRKSYSITNYGSSTHVVFCPTGERLAYTTYNFPLRTGGVCVLDTATGRLLWRAEAAHVPDQGVAFSADGAFLACLRGAGQRRDVVIRGAQTGEVQHVLATGDRGIKGLAFGPEGKVFYWDDRGNIKAHDLETGRLAWQFAALDYLRREF